MRSIKAWPDSGDLTPAQVTDALDRARDDILESAARMIEARAALYRARPGTDSMLGAKAEEAEDIAAALRALQSAGSRVAARGAD